MTRLYVRDSVSTKQNNSKSFWSPVYWPSQLFFLIMRLLAFLPYPAIHRLGILMGKAMYRLAKSRVRIAQINIKKCFPHLSEVEQENLVKQNLISTGIGMLETAMLWFGPKRNWDNRLIIEGMEHLEQAKANGKGGLLLSFHLTSLEIGGSLLGTQMELAALYRKNEKALIEHKMTKGRGQYVHPIARENTRAMVRWIKKNGFAWYAADQDYGRKQSIFVPFFNIPTATITATTRFVKLTGAPVIPMTQQRIGNGKKIKVTLHPPLENMGTDAEQDAITINRFLEHYLKQHPEDYLWIHRRFKTRPTLSSPSFYPKKKKGRQVTPNRYRDIIEAAEWIEEKDGKPYRLKEKEALIYFYYRKETLFADKLGKHAKAWGETLDSETIDNQIFKFQGLTRYCPSQKCDLVYLELSS